MQADGYGKYEYEVVTMLTARQFMKVHVELVNYWDAWEDARHMLAMRLLREGSCER